MVALTAPACPLLLRSGPNQWRDAQTPREILENVCETNNRSQPLWLSKTELVIGNKHYRLAELEGQSRSPQMMSPCAELMFGSADIMIVFRC